jgi:hypothetical protein
LNVRVIAATNIDIKAAIAQKLFPRGSLLPPERIHAEDAAACGSAWRRFRSWQQHFMRKVAAKYECEPLPISPVTADRR